MRRSFEFARGGYLPTSEMSRASNGDSGAAETRERVNELELGLSLGRGVRRIVTAEDFPSRRSRGSPISSNSSVSSSSGVLGDEAGEGDGGGSFRRAEAVGYNGTRSANSARLVLKKMMNGHFLWDVETVNSQEQKSHSQVVGWPPIRTLRRNNLVNISRVANSDIKATAYKEISQSCSSNAGKKGVGGNDGERKAIHLRKFHFVKVNMDGDPIGRKVDLHTHVSYEALALALEAMFQKPTLSLNASTNGMFSKLLDGSSEFSLIYEDEDGDWMLVGDVPWGMFLCTVKRLRIMKTMDNCGLDESVNAEARLFRPLKSSVPF